MKLAVREYLGSPPRVRGRGNAFHISKRYGRITPARAGKSRPLCASRGHGGDHPRACGEEYGTSPSRVLKMGSPPRVRGRACVALVA